MTQKKKQNVLNRTDFIKRLSQETDLSIRQATRLVQAYIKVTQDILSEDYAIKISGFGALTPVTLRARTARDPRNGDPIPLGPRRTVRFAPSKQLRNIL